MGNTIYTQPLPRALIKPGAYMPQRGNRDLYITNTYNADGTLSQTFSTKGFNQHKATMADMYYVPPEPSYDCGHSSTAQTFMDISAGISLFTQGLAAIKGLFSKSSS